MGKKRYRLCTGKGIVVNPGDKLIISNPVTGDDRLTFWDTFSAGGDRRQRGVKRIRLQCEECGRRLAASVSVCHDGCCVIFTMPAHKPKGWWKRKKKIRKEQRCHRQ